MTGLKGKKMNKDDKNKKCCLIMKKCSKKQKDFIKGNKKAATEVSSKFQGS